jgi:hypothetical protein
MKKLDSNEMTQTIGGGPGLPAPTLPKNPPPKNPQAAGLELLDTLFNL